jgi:hypothetical protein
MSRRWHRSPVLWFGLPGLIFLVLAWIDSMSNISTLDATVFGRSVRFRNSDSVISASWYSERRSSSSGMAWDLQALPREPERGESWFPLPSYIALNHVGTSSWHDLNFSYWFLIMIYLGLWQLPWLFRYHRRRRMERALTVPS